MAGIAGVIVQCDCGNVETHSIIDNHPKVKRFAIDIVTDSRSWSSWDRTIVSWNCESCDKFNEVDVPSV